MTITWDPNYIKSATLSNNNLTAQTADQGRGVRATEGKTSGKWYWEITINAKGDANLIMGIAPSAYYFDHTATNMLGYRTNGSTANGTGSGAALPTGGVLGIALDADARKADFYVNGVYQASNTRDFSGYDVIYPFVTQTTRAATMRYTVNFGASSFQYPIPEGYSSYQIQNRFLIKDGDEIKTYLNNTWQTVSLYAVSKSDFDYGMNDLSVLTSEAMSQLSSETPELLCWTNETEPTREVTMILPERWSSIGESIPDASVFLEQGMDNFNIPESAWKMLEGDFDVITYSDNLTQQVNANAQMIPFPQTVESETIFSDIAGLIIDVAGENTRFAFSDDNKQTWKVYADGWQAINKENISTNGMIASSVNALQEEQWKELNNTISALYYIEEDSMVNTIKITNPAYSISTPTLDSIKVLYEELTIEGRLKDLERINVINMAKLQFKTNTLMQSSKYKLHDLVVDTFETDSMISKFYVFKHPFNLTDVQDRPTDESINSFLYEYKDMNIYPVKYTQDRRTKFLIIASEYEGSFKIANTASFQNVLVFNQSKSGKVYRLYSTGAFMEDTKIELLNGTNTTSFEQIPYNGPSSSEPILGEGTLYRSVEKDYKGKGVVETEVEVLPDRRSTLFVSAESTDALFEYSLDNGVTWKECLLNTLMDITGESGTSLIIKAKLENDTSILRALSYAWA